METLFSILCFDKKKKQNKANLIANKSINEWKKRITVWTNNNVEAAWKKNVKVFRKWKQKHCIFSIAYHGVSCINYFSLKILNFKVKKKWNWNRVKVNSQKIAREKDSLMTEMLQGFFFVCHEIAKKVKFSFFAFIIWNGIGIWLKSLFVFFFWSLNDVKNNNNNKKYKIRIATVITQCYLKQPEKSWFSLFLTDFFVSVV